MIDNNFEEVKEALESIGYIDEGDLGIPGREVFSYKYKLNRIPCYSKKNIRYFYFELNFIVILYIST